MDLDIFENVLEPFKSWTLEDGNFQLTKIEDKGSSKNKIGDTQTGILDILLINGKFVIRVSRSYTNYMQTGEIIKIIDMVENQVIVECADGIYRLNKL